MTTLVVFKIIDSIVTKKKYLNLSKNLLHSVRGIEHITSVEEFYINLNLINDWNELKFLKEYVNLKVLDIRNNLIENEEILEKYLLYNLDNLKYINGEVISDSDFEDANTFFKGILDNDYLLRESPPETIASLSQLTVANSSIREVNLTLDNLTSVNLEHNNLTTFSSLAYLKNLKYLCLSNNNITWFGDFPKEIENEIPLFNNLEVLYLNKNNICNLEQLELDRAPNLISLYLHDNELSNILGLNKLEKLKHLVLDRNKISKINLTDVSGLKNLKTLYIEFNKLSSLKFLKELNSLKSLFLAYNRITNFDTLQNLSNTSKVKELTFHGNPLARSCSQYIVLLAFLPNLKTLDGMPLDKNKLPL